MRCDFDVSGIARCKGGRADYPAGADDHVTLRFDGDRAGIASVLSGSACENIPVTPSAPELGPLMLNRPPD